MDGIVSHVNHRRGFCLVSPLIGTPTEAECVFAHVSQCRDRVLPPPGCRVRFRLVRARDGRVQAMGLSPIEVSGARLTPKTKTSKNV